MRCDHYGEEYNPEYAHEHKYCAEEMNNFKGYSLVGGMTAPGNGESKDTSATLGRVSGSFF